MKTSEFSFMGQQSSAYGVTVQKRPEMVSPARNFYEGTPSNRNGTVLRDKGTFADTTMTLVLTYESYRTTKTIDDVIDWLGQYDFHELQLGWDPNYYYMVLAKSGMSVSPIDYLHTIYSITWALEVQPYKRYLSGYQTRSGSNLTLANPSKYVAFPYMNIKGTGGLVLKISSSESLPGTSTSQTYNIANANGSLIVDSTAVSISKPTQWNGMQMPYLNIGSNVITVTGTGASLDIDPHWLRRVG